MNALFMADDRPPPRREEESPNSPVRQPADGKRIVGNAHPRPGNRFGRDSATETILSADEAEKGEKRFGAFMALHMRFMNATKRTPQ